MIDSSGPIKFYDGLKYELAEDFWCQTGIKGVSAVFEEVRLFTDGTLHVKAGFTWNGASGPTLDTASSMRASLAHDALYQLISEKKLDMKHRHAADELLAALGKQDGMYGWRARMWLWAVDKFGGPAARSKRKAKVAP